MYKARVKVDYRLIKTVNASGFHLYSNVIMSVHKHWRGKTEYDDNT